MRKEIRGTIKSATVWMTTGGPVKVPGPIGGIDRNSDGELRVDDAQGRPLLIAAHGEWRYVEFVYE